jgi:hypothetical protein
MDALVGVWITSFVGAGAFSAAGFFAGKQSIKLPAPPPPKVEEERPSDPGAVRMELAIADLEATRSDLREARERARVAEAARADLEKQVEALKTELREEVASRATATARADETGDRLARASAEAASFRHKLSQLDRERKQLRDALQARDDVRVALKDVTEKLERTSLPPDGRPVLSSIPPRVSSQPPATDLRAELDRLTQENAMLRERALGALPARRKEAIFDVDIDPFRDMIVRIGKVAGLRAAIIADELGTVLVGSGEHAESLAAFGAYIRDATARTERLLPLDSVFEVDIRDRAGTLLCTRMILRNPSELSLVMLGAGPASIVAAKRIADESLRVK